MDAGVIRINNFELFELIRILYEIYGSNHRITNEIPIVMMLGYLNAILKLSLNRSGRTLNTLLNPFEGT